MASALHPGFRLGIFMFKDAEILDFAAPYGVFSVARRFDPALDVFFVAESLRPVQAQAGFTVLPNSAFADRPALDAFLIPGGFGTRQEMYNGRLHEYIRSLPASCLLTSVCTGSWVYGQMGGDEPVGGWKRSGRSRRSEADSSALARAAGRRERPSGRDLLLRAPSRRRLCLPEAAPRPGRASGTRSRFRSS
jgi:putative intracellular protease/amidase